MKSIWMLFLLAVVLLFSMTGCGGSTGESGSESYGSAAIQIQWPDDAEISDGPLFAGDAQESSTNADRRLAKAYLFSECETRNVVTIAVEVTDDQERLLASDAFDCEAREGIIENIEVGLDRRFVVSALDPEGEILFSGEKTGVAIEPGHNEVGVIILGSDDGVIISPHVEITAPEDGAVYAFGDEITFTGSATDEQDGDLAGDALVWRSDIDNELGTGTSLVTADLSLGTHVITLAATNSDSNTGEDSILIIISEPAQESPVATIMRPFDGSRHTNNANIYFEGAASDPQDGELTGEALVWTSDRDGAIGTGEIFVSLLSAGVHEITLTATDSDGLEGEAAVSIAVIVPGLPDTGQTTSYTATFGEDADYTIRPPSYTKLDDDGRALPENATAWAMVRDNVTGLVWEVKTTDDSIHNNNNRYTWGEADATFVSSLNQSVFGGYDDWRLPTVMELYTIIHADNVDPAVNTNYFPNVPDVARPYYWSATPRADSPSEWIWVIDFGSGRAVGYEEEVQYVRAVRGAVFRTGRFTDIGDETVRDRSTGLMWQRWEDFAVTWEGALYSCESLGLAGYEDWRVPNRHELHTIVDYSAVNPAMDTEVFIDNTAGYYWSSTSSPVDDTTAYSISFTSGFTGNLVKLDPYPYYPAVRCVRGGQ